MTLAIMLFAAMYVLLLVFSEKRWIIALCAAAVFMLAGILPVSAALPAVNWNVLLMLAGTMMTVELFIESRMPVRMSEQLLKITPNVKWAIVALSLFAGLISAFVDNVATVLMVAPVGLAVAEKLDTNPIPVIISIAVSSNLQGAATLVGDTTSILLGSYANLSFNDFFWFMGRPGICFAVEAGALATVPVLLYLFRKENKVVKSENITEVEDRVPAALLLLTIILLIVASQFPEKPEL
ncbi:MAG: arsenic transporter, partial [Solobacterium sp.]|nr:arsenic transporter [Solobacterium sp.]